MNLFKKKSTNYGKIIAISVAAVAAASAVAFVVYKLIKTVDSFSFVRTVSNDSNSRTCCDTHRKNTEQALSADAAVIFLNPNCTLKGISLLDKEGCGSSVKTHAVFYCNIA